MLANLHDIERSRQLKARYIRYGDTKRWDDLAKLTGPTILQRSFEIAPRFSKDQPGRAESQSPISSSTMGQRPGWLVTMHTVFLPEITLISPTAAMASGGCMICEDAQLCI